MINEHCAEAGANCQDADENINKNNNIIAWRPQVKTRNTVVVPLIEQYWYVTYTSRSS
jgi:hypothetical protein